MLDRSGGTLLGITIWDSEDQAQAAGAALGQVRDANARAMGAAPTTAAYEVIAQLWPSSAIARTAQPVGKMASGAAGSGTDRGSTMTNATAARPTTEEFPRLVRPRREEIGDGRAD